METRVSKNKKQLKEDKKRVKNKRKERLKKSRNKIDYSKYHYSICYIWSFH